MALNMMECRYAHLQQMLDGYLQTGMPFIEYNGTHLIPAFNADDLGIYYFIPRLAYYFQLPLDTAIALFFNGLSFSALLLGIIGCCLLYKSWSTRIIACTGITLVTLYASSQTMDVYRAYCAAPIAIIPLFLYAFKQHDRFWWFATFLSCAGIYLGLLHHIRSYAGTGVMLFMLFLLVTQVVPHARKTLLVLLLLVGFTMPMLFFNHVYHQYTSYAATELPMYPLDGQCHVFWHQIYIGLGFLNNPFGLRYSDVIAHRKAVSVDPNIIYPCAASETILQHEVIAFIMQHPYFFFLTLGAKIGILLLFLLVFANIGLIAAYYYPKGWRIECAFAIAISFNCLFGILSVPSIAYSLGLIACSALYGIVSINYALEHKVIKSMMQHIQRLLR